MYCAHLIFAFCTVRIVDVDGDEAAIQGADDHTNECGEVGRGSRSYEEIHGATRRY